VSVFACASVREYTLTAAGHRFLLRHIVELDKATWIWARGREAKAVPLGSACKQRSAEAENDPDDSHDQLVDEVRIEEGSDQCATIEIDTAAAALRTNGCE
jgi:hypothetical protein